MNKCEKCEGIGYYNLSASYDDVHSRIECEDCLGCGLVSVLDCDEQKLHNDNYITQGKINKINEGSK